MRFNVFKPRDSVQSALDRPDNQTAFVIVIIPAILSAVGLWAFGFPFRPTLVGLALVRSVLNWLLLAAFSYIILYLAIGKKMQGRFNGILSCVSLLWVINLLMLVCGMVFLPFIFSGEILDAAKELATGQISVDEFAANANQVIEYSPQAVNTSLGIVIMVLAGLLMALSAYILFLMVRDLQGGRAFSNAVVTLVILLAWLSISIWTFYLVQIA